MSKPPLFRQSPPFYISFLWIPPLNNQIFQWTHKTLKFSSLTRSYLLKVIKFLVKISQFEFLVMTEKKIFVYKHFVHQIFQISFHFVFFFFFFVKLKSPLEKKVTPSFPATPLSKLKSSQVSPFWKFGRKFNPSSRKEGGVHTMVLICQENGRANFNQFNNCTIKILKQVNTSKNFALFCCKNNFICIWSWKSKKESKFEAT